MPTSNWQRSADAAQLIHQPPCVDILYRVKRSRAATYNRSAWVICSTYASVRFSRNLDKASIKILAGDFVAGKRGTFSFGILIMPTPEHPFLGEQIPLAKVMRVSAVNKEIDHCTGAAVGRGLVGAIIAGPAGAIIGAATTNHKSEVTFEAEFEGGRRLLATATTAVFTKLLAAAFDYKPRPVVDPDAERHAAIDRADATVSAYLERQHKSRLLAQSATDRAAPRMPEPSGPRFGKRR